MLIGPNPLTLRKVARRYFHLISMLSPFDDWTLNKPFKQEHGNDDAYARAAAGVDAVHVT